MESAKAHAKKMAAEYVKGQLPPEAAPAGAAAQALAEGGSAEDAANAAMQATCVMATGGAGAVACQFATVDTLVTIQHAVFDLLPSSWQARGKMQCWFYDYQVVNLAKQIFEEMANLVDKSYQDTRRAIGLPPRLGVARMTYLQEVMRHPKWTSHEEGWYSFDKSKCDWSGPQVTCAKKKIKLPGGNKGPWYWESTSRDDCEEFGIKSFNQQLMRLYTNSRLLAARESIGPALRKISKDLDSELQAIRASAQPIPTAPRFIRPDADESTDNRIKIAAAVTIASVATAAALWIRRSQQ